MSTFAAIAMEPVNVLVWLLAGGIAGWLAGRVMKGSGHGVFENIIVGLIGGVIGGFVFGQVSNGPHELIGSIVVAFIGACILFIVHRFMVRGHSRF